MADVKRSENLSYIGIITAAAFGFYLSSLYSYLLFHGLIEISTIAVAFTIFILTWNTRRYLTNNYLRLLGIGYAFIALIDLLHTLAYKGMNVFPGYGANLPTQLWIAARYLQIVTLLAAPLLMERKMNNRAVFGVYAVAVSVLVMAVYSGNFPDCFIEGKGLTAFKVISEYVISVLLLASLYLLFRKRKYFADRVFFLITSSIACTVLSEVSFTAYVSVYGFANLVGHFAKLAAFYLIYRAILVTGLREPLGLIFRDLKQAEDALRKSQNTLEEKVRERTAELSASEDKYRSLIQNIQVAVVVHDPQTEVITSNSFAQTLLGLTEAQMRGKEAIDPAWSFLREDGTVMPVDEYPVSRVAAAGQPLRDFVVGVNRPDLGKVVWALVNADPVLNDKSNLSQVIVSFVDITERKRAEEALQASEDRYCMAQAIGHVGSWEYNLQTTRFWGSDEAKRMYGFDPAQTDFTTEEVERCIPERERVHQALIDLIEEGKAYNLEFEIRPRNAAEPRIIASIAELQRDGHGNPMRVVGVIQDITERKQAEAELTRVNRVLRMLNDTNWALIHITDEATLLNEVCRIAVEVGGYRLLWVGFAEQDEAKTVRPVAQAGFEDGYLESVNITWADGDRGRSPTGIAIRTGQPCIARNIPEDPAFAPWREAATRRGYQSSIALPLTSEGRAFGALNIYAGEVDAFDAKEVEMLKELTDGLAFGITALRTRSERMRAEEALYEQQQVFRTLVENSPDIIARYDRDCRRIYVNPVYMKEARIPQQELLTTSPTQRSPLPAASAAVLQNLLRRVLDSGVAEAVDVIWPKADNIDYWYNIYASPEFDREGRVVSVMTISRDITERKHAEEEIRRLNQELEKRVAKRTAQLEASNKELESFAYSVSHDLRAPLRHVDGFLELLQEKTATILDEQSRHYMATISDSAKQMGTLIDDLLSFSRMRRQEMSKMHVDLGALVREVIRELEPETQGRDIHWRVADLPKVTGDRAMLRIVLANLISNAWKFTRLQPQPEIEIDWIRGQEDDTIMFIRDNGVGFDMTYGDKLFGVFQRLHRADEFEGTGIGLANVRRIIDRHGGKTWAEGQVNHGATFYFSLPQPDQQET
ncbi:MAG: MASE3 domain-containing protein [Syntrophales bacterium]|nr:MASE3 domain-containing protein [Syntrophales bacterium]